MFTNTIATCTFSYCKVPSSQLHTRPGAKDFICEAKMRYLKLHVSNTTNFVFYVLTIPSKAMY